jgi:hypothetical protein
MDKFDEIDRQMQAEITRIDCLLIGVIIGLLLGQLIRAALA